MPPDLEEEPQIVAPGADDYDLKMFKDIAAKLNMGIKVIATAVALKLITIAVLRLIFSYTDVYLS